ncbi:hypothetical protein EDD86DRAFT_96895 [Gorgonomyces haynaldii]|nr:hypothetical protein EDD86DRAFT_96895 [Gorgonomyces haynaldii]
MLHKSLSSHYDSYMRKVDKRNFSVMPLSRTLFKAMTTSLPMGILSFLIILASFLLSLVYPLSLLGLLLHFTEIHQLSTFTVFWCACECVFFLYHETVAERLQALSIAPTVSRKRAHELVDHIIQNTKDGKSFVQGWFFNADIGKVRWGHLMEWAAYAFAGKDVDDLTPEQHLITEEICHKLNQKLRLGIKTQVEEESDIQCMKHVLHRVQYVHHPLVYYCATHLFLHNLAHVYLRYNRFQFHQKDKIQYYMYDPKTKASESKSPIVYFHGIGAGLSLYIPFIRKMLTRYRYDRRIILLHMPEIGQRIPNTSPIFSKQEFVQGIQDIFKVHQIQKATFIGHSFGTICLAWIVNDCPQLVDACYFSDPVCFQLQEPDVCFNFVYRQPSNFFQIIVWFFAAREIGISSVLSRHFWWYASLL